MTIEVSSMRRCSGKLNKLRYKHTIRGTRGTSTSWKGKLTTSQSELSCLSYIFVETKPLFIDKFRSKKGAAVLKEFYLV